MKNFLKIFGLMASILVELIGLLLVFMQYEILSQDIFILVSAIASGVLITFGCVVFARTLVHEAMAGEEKQTARTRQKKPSVIIFWLLLISSLVMMIITNVLAYAGFSYRSAAVLCSGGIWFICFFITAIMYLFDVVIIDDEERQRKERLNEIREQLFTLVDQENEEGEE